MEGGVLDPIFPPRNLGEGAFCLLRSHKAFDLAFGPAHRVV